MTSDLCPTCRKPFHKRRRRFLEQGTYGKKGRPRKVDYYKIVEMKKNCKDMSYRQLAQKNGATIGMVQRALKEAGLVK